MNRNNFGHDTTAEEVIEGVNLKGKLVLITGASSGIGVETARVIAHKGARIVITARNMEKGQKVVEDIINETGNSAIEVMELELASIKSIRAFANAFLKKYSSLNILINNAGVMACPFDKTEDGFEKQFGTNHLGHFLLTNLLTPALIKGAPSRVVNLSSRAHKLAPVTFEDINFENREYLPWTAYGQSKTANILHVVELERRLKDKNVHAYAAHPGVIYTELTRHLTEEDNERLASIPRKSLQAGAATTVYAATAPELEGKGGIYLYDCKISEIDEEGTLPEGVRPYAYNESSAKKLWEVSEEMVN